MIVFESGAGPCFGPPEREVSKVGERDVSLDLHVGHSRRRFDVDALTRGAKCQAEVHLLASVQESFVEPADPVQDIPAHEHAMELQKLGWLSDERGWEIVDAAAFEEVVEAYDAAASFFADVRKPARHVNDAVVGSAFEVERPDGGGPRLLRASHKRREPSRLDEDIVVQKHDIGGRRVRESKIARLIGCEVMLGADQVEPPAPGLFGQAVSHFAGRTAIDIDEREWGIGVLVEVFE